MENENTLEVKAAFLAALSYIGVPVDIAFLLGAVSIFDTLVGATLSIRLGTYNTKKLIIGIWVKILLLGVVFLFALSAQILEYEGVKTLSDAFIRIMLVNEGFSAFNNIRGLKNNKKYKEIDLLSIFFNFVKKLIFDYLDRLKIGEDERDSEKYPE